MRRQSAAASGIGFFRENWVADIFLLSLCLCIRTVLRGRMLLVVLCPGGSADQFKLDCALAPAGLCAGARKCFAECVFNIKSRFCNVSILKIVHRAKPDARSWFEGVCPFKSPLAAVWKGGGSAVWEILIKPVSGCLFPTGFLLKRMFGL